MLAWSSGRTFSLPEAAVVPGRAIAPGRAVLPVRLLAASAFPCKLVGLKRSAAGLWPRGTRVASECEGVCCLRVTRKVAGRSCGARARGGGGLAALLAFVAALQRGLAHVLRVAEEVNSEALSLWTRHRWISSRFKNPEYVPGCRYH